MKQDEPTPTSIKTAEEILKECRDEIYYSARVPEKDEAELKAMQEYKNQFTGDKWSDEDMLMFAERCWQYINKASPYDVYEFKSFHEMLYNYKNLNNEMD